MTVKELMDILQRQDPNAQVKLISQPNWPLEHDIKGIVNCDDLSDEDNHVRPRRPSNTPSDVLIVEGEQIGYGPKAAWTVISHR
jgi:hypothetical protein